MCIRDRPYLKRVYQEWFFWVFKSFFLSFSFSNLSSFLTQAWAYPLLYPSSIGSLFVRVFVGDQEKWSPSVPPLYWRSYRGCDLGKESFVVIKWSDHQVFKLMVGEVVRGAASASLRACVCLFLREQVRRLVSPRVLVWTPCRCCGTQWSNGIDSSGNPS